MKRVQSLQLLCWKLVVLAAALAAAGQAQTPMPPQKTMSNIPKRITLEQAESLLIERNLAVLAAKYQISANRAAALIASFRPNPVLTIGAEQFNLSNRFFKNIARTDSNSAAATTYTIRYDQLIERGHKRELRMAQADYQLKASEAQMLDAIRTQLYQLRQAFTTASLARENLLVARETEQQYQQTVALTAAKVENGDLAGVELYRVQAATMFYQQAVQQARTMYQQASRDVLNLLGAKPEEVKDEARVSTSLLGASVDDAGSSDGGRMLDASFTSQAENAGGPSVSAAGESALPGASEDLLEDAPLYLEYKFNDRPIGLTTIEMRQIALRERPDVIAAHNLLSAAEENVALMQAQRVRDVSVGTFVQRVGSDQTVGVNLSIPLFVHNKGLAAVEQAQQQKETAAALARQAEMQAVTEVEKAYLAYQTARKTLDIYSSMTLERASKLKNIASFSYKEGAINLLELLDAQRIYNQTINSYNQARADYQMALWQLEQSIGKPIR